MNILWSPEAIEDLNSLRAYSCKTKPISPEWIRNRARIAKLAQHRYSAIEDEELNVE